MGRWWWWWWVSLAFVPAFMLKWCPPFLEVGRKTRKTREEEKEGGG
jgi:hypothetical protein